MVNLHKKELHMGDEKWLEILGLVYELEEEYDFEEKKVTYINKSLINEKYSKFTNRKSTACQLLI